MLYLDEDVCVRIEATTVITSIYDLDTIEDTSDNFCDIMSHLIFTSNEKKLKLKVLDFWHKVIDMFLRRFGIVDYHIPEATFSKQLKRIIHFNRQTIRNTFHSILSDLNQVGCLAIFIHIFSEENDFEICSATKNCYEGLIQLLKEHTISYYTSNVGNYSDSSLPFDFVQSAKDVDVDSLSRSPSPMSFISDFESIDFQELGVLDNSDLSSYSAVSNDTDCDLKGRQIISLNDFLKFVYSDFDVRYADIQFKANYSKDFDRLLDEILSQSRRDIDSS